MESFNITDLNLLQWITAFLCSMLIGMNKVGIAGIGLLVVVLLADIFGGKSSSGILLPILNFADIFAVTYYHKSAKWQFIIKLLPWTFIGIIIGLIVGSWVSDRIFKTIIGIVVLISITIMFIREINKNELKIPDYRWFAAIMGLAGGFTTMIGNAAGSVMALYLLSMKLPKNSYIGTSAWFFMIVNLIKIPLHLFIWKTITFKSFLFDIALIPAIILGGILGILIVKRIPEKPYRYFIMAITAVSSIILFIR